MSMYNPKEMLTGRRRHRTGLRGRLVLQVEVTKYRPTVVDDMGSEPPWSGSPYDFWRDARAEDVTTLDKEFKRP